MANQTIGEIFNSLATQIGIDTDSDEVKNILSNPALSQIKVSDEVAGKLTTGFLTVQSAKNNPEINKYFKAKHLTTVDDKLQKSLKSAGIDSSVLDELNSLADTHARIENLVPKLSEFYKASSVSAGNGEDKKKYDELLSKYNKSVSDNQKLVEDFSSKEKGLLSDMEQREINWELKSMINSYPIAESFQKEDINILVSNKLSKLPYVFKKGENGIGVFQKENPDLIASYRNKALTVKDVMDEIISPYIKKADEGGNGAAGKPVIVNKSTPYTNDNASANLKSNMEQFEKLTGKKIGA